MNAIDWPAVTVAVATRDRPELLAKAIESILDQDYPGEIEIAVVFDQSTPDHGLASRRPGRTVRMLTNARTPGLAGARNSGISATASALVAFCDDDDRWHPSKLRRQVEAMRASGTSCCVTGIAVHYGQTVRERIPAVNPITIAELSRSRMTGAHPSSYLIDRSMLERVGLVDEDLPYGYGEDYDLLIRLAEAGDIAVVQEPLVDVLWHPQSFFAQRWTGMAAGLGYLIGKHPVLRANRRGLAWIEGQRAFALAAAGERRAAWRVAARSISRDPKQPRGWLALLVGARLLSAKTVIDALNARGRGI
ncbi:MAG: glycosyltransferase family 2 protein [Sporichthyaceae bacterium]|nr:glycosyltransferase family 2 protein [Sporichthyaceae bacterium]